MERREPTINPENSEQTLEILKQEADVEMEIISGVPVFTIETDRKDEAISRISQSFGKNTVFRIINAHFVDDAIEFGTDKERVDEHDFRRVAYRAGYDFLGVEDQAIKLGLKKSDVFCGTPYIVFIKADRGLNSSGLGIPNDRAAILIYDGEKLQQVEGHEETGYLSDGYAFKDVEKKKDALLGIMKFRELLTEFEKELQAFESADDKVALLKKEVFQNLNTPDDLKKAPYLALNIIALLHSESLENASNPSETSTERINILKTIADRLEHEIIMIKMVDNMASQVAMTRKAFATQNEQEIECKQVFPDFVIETTQDYLLNSKLDQKYRDALTQVIEDAKKCKQEFGIGKLDDDSDLQQDTRGNLKGALEE